MKLRIIENGKETLLDVNDFVHYANTVHELGDSKWLAMSQYGVTKAISDLFENINLKNIFFATGPCGTEDDLILLHYQNYIDYLELVIQDTNNQIPELNDYPTFLDYLNYLDYDIPIDPETEGAILRPVECDIVTSFAVNHVIITDKNLRVSPNLKVGFSFVVISNSENKLDITLPPGEEFTRELFPTDIKRYQFIKISETEWVANDLDIDDLKIKVDLLELYNESKNT